LPANKIREVDKLLSERKRSIDGHSQYRTLTINKQKQKDVTPFSLKTEASSKHQDKSNPELNKVSLSNLAFSPRQNKIADSPQNIDLIPCSSRLNINTETSGHSLDKLQTSNSNLDLSVLEDFEQNLEDYEKLSLASRSVLKQLASLLRNSSNALTALTKIDQTKENEESADQP